MKTVLPLPNLKLIFIHGIDDQQTNYSCGLFQRILNQAARKLRARGLPEGEVQDLCSRIVRHEVMWADLTADLTNRYCQLQYQPRRSRWPWTRLMKGLDPLAMQIMQYIKDKGDKSSGAMNILKEVDQDIQKIFFQTNIGEFVPGRDKHAVLVAHSLGAVIAFDYIFCFRDRCMLDKQVTIHSFITMGSPLPVFTSAMGHPDSDLTLPPNVKRWVNLISPKDGIARYVRPFFKQIPIDEKEVRTGLLPIQAHAGYWKSDRVASLIADEALTALEAGV